MQKFVQRCKNLYDNNQLASGLEKEEQPTHDHVEGVKHGTGLLIGSLEVEVSCRAADTSALDGHVDNTLDKIAANDEYSTSFVSVDVDFNSVLRVSTYGVDSSCDEYIF